MSNSIKKKKSFPLYQIKNNFNPDLLIQLRKKSIRIS